VTIRKERSTSPSNSLIKPLHDRLLGEEIVADVGVRVIAGVNLRHLREEDVQITGQQVTITLLPAKVLMVYVDESLTRIVSHRAGWFTSRDFKLIDGRSEARGDGSAGQRGIGEPAPGESWSAVGNCCRCFGSPVGL
jgi:hypothetical protein